MAWRFGMWGGEKQWCIVRIGNYWKILKIVCILNFAYVTFRIKKLGYQFGFFSNLKLQLARSTTFELPKNCSKSLFLHKPRPSSTKTDSFLLQIPLVYTHKILSFLCSTSKKSHQRWNLSWIKHEFWWCVEEGKEEKSVFAFFVSLLKGAFELFEDAFLMFLVQNESFSEFISTLVLTKSIHVIKN